jgi:prepilin-type N-terminal cleavage/methylation domain-containing protein
MKKYIKHSKKSGFTAIELLLAIVILGGMLTLTMTVVVGMLRFYVFSNSVRKNQANGRDTLDLITRDIRFGTLLTPTAIDPGPSSKGKICVYLKSDKKIVIYRYGADTNNTLASATDLYRKVYKYTANNDPTTCDETNLNFKSSLAEETLTKLNLEKMYITKFDVVSTQGASFEVKPDAAAVVIDYGFLTGNANASGTGCDSANIFCSNLGYVTAINLRAGGI